MYVCVCICIYVCTYVHTWVCLCVCTSKEMIRVCSWRHRWGCQNMWLIPWFCRALGRISFMLLWPHTAFFLLGFCHMFLGLSLLWPLGPTRIPALSLIPPWCSPLVCSGWDVFHHPGSRLSSMAGGFLPLIIRIHLLLKRSVSMPLGICEMFQRHCHHRYFVTELECLPTYF